MESQMISLIDSDRLSHVKRAFSTRNVELSDIKAIDITPRKPQAGDIVLARVEEVGRLQRIELPTGRRSALYKGDELLLVYGNRYAPDAYEALLPEDLGPCDLAAAGGLISRVVETNLKFASEDRLPTRLQPVGLCIGPDGNVLNLSSYVLRQTTARARRTPVICVFGASMNAGKTTTVAGIVRGLTQQGLKVGTAKVTGTCSGGDLWKFSDAGAIKTLDFTDSGMATTYLEKLEKVRGAARKMIAHLEDCGSQVIVLEIADGLHQLETRSLLEDAAFRSMVDHWMFAADNAASIMVGMEIATNHMGLDIKAVSGAVTASPLALREASELTSAPILNLPSLQDGAITKAWIDGVRPDIPTTTSQRLAG